jgi:hypothetical protein
MLNRSSTTGEDKIRGSVSVFDQTKMAEMIIEE